MIERIPLTRATQLDELDMAEVTEGYSDGFAGEPEPGDNRSFAYWHGWRNGYADKFSSPDAAQMELARDYVKQNRNRPTVEETK
jgi:chitinase